MASNTYNFPTVISVSQMNNKHLSFKIQLMNVMPSKMLNPFASRERTNTSIIDAKIQLGTAMILARMWINTVGLKCARQMYELVIYHACVLPGLTFLMELYCLLF